MNFDGRSQAPPRRQRLYQTPQKYRSPGRHHTPGQSRCSPRCHFVTDFFNGGHRLKKGTAMRSLVFQINRQGATRIVVLIGPLALKFPFATSWARMLTGMLCNLQERRFAKIRSPDAAPVLWADPAGMVVVMPRVQILSPDEFLLIDYDRFVGAGIPVERKWNSFGWLNGRVVAIDYGS